MELDKRSRQWIITYPQQEDLNESQLFKYNKLPGWKSSHAIQSKENKSVSIFIDLKYQLKASRLISIIDNTDTILKSTTLKKLQDFKRLPFDKQLVIENPMSNLTINDTADVQEHDEANENEEHSSESEQGNEHSSNTNESSDIHEWLQKYGKRKRDNDDKLITYQKRLKVLQDAVLEVEQGMKMIQQQDNEKISIGYDDLMKIIHKST